MKDVWNYLQTAGKPILLYGMGNGAEKILNVFEKYGIDIYGVFASDGFVRGNVFRGHKITSYSDMIKTYPDPIIVLGFASNRPEVIEHIKTLSEKHELYAPDVPVYGEELFNSIYCAEHAEDLAAARDIFCDTESKSIFDEVISYKLDGKISHLLSAVTERETVYRKILHAEKFKNCVDLGAYNGDTLRELISFGCDPDNIYCFEPDVKSYAKLEKYTASLKAHCENHNICAYDKKDLLKFGTEGNRGSAAGKSVSQTKQKEVPADSLDNVLGGRPADYIKYDVEGSEYEALTGSVNTIEKYRPALCVSLYHRSEDIFRLPLLLKKIRPDYEFHLCRFYSLPAWELNLYAI